ncbi:MAG: VCBS repeat-containing protein, partial [Pseudomonadota bacterium]
KLEHIAPWVSALGSAISVGDIDGDAVTNDICLVEPRDNTVTIMPVPERKPARFKAFNLTPPTVGFAEGSIAPMGCLFADVNADGLEDVTVYYWGRSPVIFENSGSIESTRFRALEAFDPDGIWFTSSALFADFDGDGHGDFLFGDYFQRNMGVLDRSGVLPVQMPNSLSRASNGGPNTLWLNNSDLHGHITFEQVNHVFDSDNSDGWTLALGAGDLDGDQLPEIYVANDQGPDRFYKNMSTPGKPAFKLLEGVRGASDIRSEVLGQDTFKGMGVDFGDINDDGLLDIFISNIAEEYALNESHLAFLQEADQSLWQKNIAPFRNQSGNLGVARSSWAWDAKLADLNNDGRLELVQATGFLQGSINKWPEVHELSLANDEIVQFVNRWPKLTKKSDLSGHRRDAFFVQDEHGVFHDIAKQIGLEAKDVSRGIATGDFDADGDLDFAISRQWQPSSVFLNTIDETNQSLILDLRLSNHNGTTRAAIGAAAKIELKNQSLRIGYSDVSNGHSGRRSSEIHFGLGDIDKETLLSVSISWRGKSGSINKNLLLKPGRHRIIIDKVKSLNSKKLVVSNQ